MSTLLNLNREEGGASEESYESWTKDELQAELSRRDLPTSGNKPELIVRLEEDDGAA